MKAEADYDTRELLLELRVPKNGIKGDYIPLAELTGGIDDLKIKQVQTKDGLKTTIEFTSLGGNLVARDYNRTKRRREIAARRLADAKTEPT